MPDIISNNDPNEPHSAPLFETLAILDDTEVDPETGYAIPSEINVAAAKRWVEENRL